MGNLTIWLTPIWVLGAGITAGMLVLAIIWGILWVISRRTAESALRLTKESVLLWVSYVAIVFIAFFLLATPVMPVKSIWNSLNRLPDVGERTVTVKVPARTDDMEVPLSF